MKLTVESEIQSIDVLGKPDIVEFNPVRQVSIDGKRLPPGLNSIVLAGLDQLAGEYLDQVERKIKMLGWRFT